MSAVYTRTDRVHSLRERERMRREIDEKERALGGHVVIPHVNGAGPEGMNARRQGRWEQHLDKDVREDAGLLRSQIRHIRNTLEKGSPRNLSRRERQSLEKQVREDTEYFKKNMVRSRLYFKKSNDPEFEKAKNAIFQKEVANPEFRRRSERFKNNMRELAPDDPTVSSVERFRPK